MSDPLLIVVAVLVVFIFAPWLLYALTVVAGILAVVVPAALIAVFVGYGLSVGGDAAGRAVLLLVVLGLAWVGPALAEWLEDRRFRRRFPAPPPADPRDPFAYLGVSAPPRPRSRG